jgi:Lipoxygenase
MIRDALSVGIKLLILQSEDVLLQVIDAFDSTHQPMGTVKGRLVYADEPGKPLHHVKLELWDRDLGTTELGQRLASGYTDRDGRFLIPYSIKKAGFMDTPDLSLKVIERTPFYRNQQLNYRERCIYKIPGPNNVTDTEYDFWEHSVPYWGYRSYRSDASAALPRLAMTPLQVIVEGIDTEFRKQLRRLTKKYQGIVFRQALRPQSVAALQQLFHPLSRTQEIERRKPGLSRSDAYFADRILNGMNPCRLRKGDAPNQFRLVYNWDAYANAKNPDYDLHNVEVLLEVPAEGSASDAASTIGRAAGAAAGDQFDDSMIDESTAELQKESQSRTRSADQPAQKSAYPGQDPSVMKTVSPSRLMPIGMTIETTGADGIKQPPATYKPGDPQWEQAKRIVRTNYLFSGELIAHFIQGHLQTEQFAVAAFRNLRYNPIHLLLFPHLKGVVHVNFRADKSLVGPNGFISQAGPLAWEQGLQPMCQDIMGQLDWDQWQPRAAITPRHRYANAAKTFWDILDQYVSEFLDQHRSEISRQWFEIRAMSDDLVTHSVAYNPDPVTDWADLNEASKPPRQRANATGPLKAVSPITETQEPGPNDLDHLKQFCKYAIFHATFWHSWVNDGQVDDGGEVAYSSLALRNGSFSQSNDPEADETIAPTPDHVARQLALMHILTKASYGYIVNNEDVDIPPTLIKLLNEKKSEFRLAGKTIDSIRSLINI